MKPFVLTIAALGALSTAASAEVSWSMSFDAQNMDQEVVGTYDLGIPNPINVTLEMTNFTGVDWIGLDFEILPSAFQGYDPGDFDLIVFDATAPRSTTISPAIEDLDPANKRLEYKFPSAPFDAGDTHTFTFTILNPNIQLFDLAIRPVVPTPGTLALAGVGLGMVARRRRG